MADIDWAALKVAYVTGKMSYKALASQYGISENTLEKRARKEKWADERRKYAGKVVAKAQARAQARDVKRLMSLQSAGNRMCKELEKLMRDADRELHTHVTAFGEEVQAKAVNDKKLLNITRSIDTMSRAMRNLYDIQTAAERAQMENAREELNLKKRAQEAKEREGQGVTEIRVTYEGIEDGPEAYHD